MQSSTINVKTIPAKKEEGDKDDKKSNEEGNPEVKKDKKKKKKKKNKGLSDFMDDNKEGKEWENEKS